MTSIRLLETALLLGVYVLLAGLYGLTYGIDRFRHRRWTYLAARGFYALHCVAAVVAVVWAPLDPGWKLLLVASSAAIFFIPRLTWHFLERTHVGEVQS
jgi:hypothetical protein